MHVKFADIPAEGVRYDIKDITWFPDDELHRLEPVTATVSLVRKGERVFLMGTMSTAVQLDCDRCLESFAHRFDSDFDVEFEVTDAGRRETMIAEHVCDENEMDMIYLDLPEVDVFQVLRQQVFLAMPSKAVCADDCLGLCPKCGANRNVETCGCRTDKAGSAFSVLAKLKQ